MRLTGGSGMRKRAAARGRFFKGILSAAVALWLAILGHETLAGVTYYAVSTNVNLAKNLNATATGGNNPGAPLLFGWPGQTDFALPAASNVWQVNLGSVESIRHVEIYAVGQSVYDATNYYIEFSTNNVSWTLATNVVGKPDGVSYVAELNGALARYIKLVGTAFNGGFQFTIFAADIFSAATQMQIRASYDLAGRKSNTNNAFVALYGNAGSETAAPELNDEIPWNFFTCGGFAAMPKSMILRFQRAYMLRAVRWHTYGSGWSNPTNYTIEASKGGVTWTQVYATNGALPTDSRYSLFFMGLDDTNGIAADRVRITINNIGGGADGLYIREVEVFGSDIITHMGTLILIQ